MNIRQVIQAVADETQTSVGDWYVGEGPATGVGVEYYVYNEFAQMMAYVCVEEDEITTLEVQNYNDQPEPDVNDDDGLTDAEADAITLGERYDDGYQDFAYDHLERDHDEPYEGA